MTMKFLERLVELRIRFVLDEGRMRVMTPKGLKLPEDVLAGLRAHGRYIRERAEASRTGRFYPEVELRKRRRQEEIEACGESYDLVASAKFCGTCFRYKLSPCRHSTPGGKHLSLSAGGELEVLRGW